MKINELIRLLRESGAILVRHGANHDWWENPKNGKRFPVPRHGSQEVPTGTLKSIKAKAGLK